MFKYLLGVAVLIMSCNNPVEVSNPLYGKWEYFYGEKTNSYDYKYTYTYKLYPNNTYSERDYSIETRLLDTFAKPYIIENTDTGKFTFTNKSISFISNKSGIDNFSYALDQDKFLTLFQSDTDKITFTKLLSY